jgi:NAD(P)-dependent dehydrogenase (short-subunit alcohol dehydrogenase family)
MNLHPRLAGKNVVVTGGTTGIGLAAAQRLAAEGARVAITGRNAERLAAAGKLLPAGTLVIEADSTIKTDTERAFRQIGEAFGRIDALFANAGVALPGRIEEVDEAHIDHHFGVNFKGVFFSIQQSVPFMQPGASIILNTSWLADVGTPGLSILSASKAAVRSLARTLSAELAGRGIRVNAVSPGAIATPIHSKMGLEPAQLEAMAKHMTAQIPLARMGNAEEVAAAVAFLASDDSSYMLGAEIAVDGGFAQL